jgi:uncharacterized protein (DUF924 family)
MDPEAIIRFWFDEHGPVDWFSGRLAFDALIAERFAPTHAALARGEGFAWRGTPEGRLAEIIALDQFSRQLFRGKARAFAQDGAALALAQEAVAQGIDRRLEGPRRLFLYMPYMHAESLLVHEEALRLFGALGDENTLRYEQGHHDCIARFGRYPFRNAALGRISTPEELAYIEAHRDRGF